MTPGRVSEAMAAAGTASLENAIMHVDWNQASIDSNHVCRDGERPGDYVQWTPMELAYLHDWNVIYVPDGRDFQQVIAAQRRAAALDNGQPTAVVYHTTKGWKYGIEGRASHGAGHKLCTEPFYQAVEPLLEFTERELPRCDDDCQRCAGGASDDVIEDCYWQALEVVRDAVTHNKAMAAAMAARLTAARDRLDHHGRTPREGAPDAEKIFVAAVEAADTPAELALTPGKSTTLRAELGRVLGHYSQVSGGAVFAASADLLDSTSVSKATAGFPEGFYNAVTNSESRTLSIGGICEDAMIAMCSGLAAYGRHAPAGSSYGAFIAPLGHIAARLHAIGNQSRQAISPGEPYRPFFLVCAHAGVKTGEDGPTHADPQALQLLQENFPASTVITLTPWDPQEMFPLVSAALARRPAVIAPFVTRPNETVIDREALGLAPAAAARTGVYPLRRSSGAQGDGTVVLQGSEVAYAFVQDTLPMLEKEGVDLNVYYVASVELFDMLPAAERARIFPAERAGEAMGITGFTLPTMYRWVTSERGRALSLYPFRNGHFLGSGKAHKVLEEAGIDGDGQFKAIMRYVQENR
jgi:transketolase